MDGTFQSVGAFAPATFHKETSDDYAKVICADGRWRVITCKGDIQWIIQHGKKAGTERHWRGVSYETTKSNVLALLAAKTGASDQDVAHLSEILKGADHVA